MIWDANFKSLFINTCWTFARKQFICNNVENKSCERNTTDNYGGVPEITDALLNYNINAITEDEQPFDFMDVDGVLLEATLETNFLGLSWLACCEWECEVQNETKERWKIAWLRMNNFCATDIPLAAHWVAD